MEWFCNAAFLLWLPWFLQWPTWTTWQLHGFSMSHLDSFVNPWSSVRLQCWKDSSQNNWTPGVMEPVSDTSLVLCQSQWPQSPCPFTYCFSPININLGESWFWSILSWLIMEVVTCITTTMCHRLWKWRTIISDRIIKTFSAVCTMISSHTEYDSPLKDRYVRR